MKSTNATHTPTRRTLLTCRTLPPRVLTAGFDPLRDGGKAAEQLVREGISTHYENYEDMVYDFMTFRNVDRAHEAIVDVADDLADALVDA